MAQPSRPPGWYPDPSDPLNQKQIYWNGSSWGETTGGPPSVVPAPPGTDTANRSKQTAIAIGVCVLAGIGLVMSMQSVSLLTGTGSLWTGVGVAAAGTAAAFFLGAAKWVRVVAALCLAFSVFNAIYMDNQLSQKRSEISEIFNN
jgi:hypothetical protein